MTPPGGRSAPRRTMAPRNKLAGLVGAGLALAAWFAAAYYPLRPALAWVLGGAGAAAAAHFLYHERRLLRAAVAGRQARHGANAALVTAACLGILVLLNVLAGRHNRTWDLTADRRFTLAEQSVRVLRELDREVRITAFFPAGDDTRQELEDRLDAYRNHSPHLAVAVVDPDRRPALARQYGIRTYGTTVFESGDQSFRTTEVGEQALTNALVRVTRAARKTVCFLSGHGEHGARDEQRGGYSTAARALEEQGFAVRDVMLLREGAVPAACAVLVAAGPTKPLLPAELEALRSYRDGGGQLALLLDPAGGSGLEAVAAEWGARLRDDIVVDPMSRLFGGSSTTPILTEYPPHDLTRGFEMATFLPLARSIALAEPAPEGVSAAPLALTTPQAWGETAVDDPKASFDPTVDAKGPLVAAALLERPDTAEAPGGRVLVVGDADFAANTYFGFSGNGDLFQNAVSYLAREDDLIAIRPRDAASSPLVLTRAQGATLLYTSVVLAPLALILGGLTIWWKRKNL